jgi:GR25 family glycosyltransferase involved in LPS biosynthesis
MLPVYCVHYSPLTERREYIQSSCVGKFCQFVSINQEEKKEYIYSLYNPSEKLWQKRCEGLYLEIPPFRELKIGDLGCSINHLIALSNACKNEYSLIIEDDAIFDSDIWRPIKKLIAFNQGFFEWDVAIIGGAFNHTIAPTIVEAKDFGGNRIILKGPPSTNTVCAYIINGNALTENKMVLPIDFEYNYWFKELNFRVVHYVPYPIIEGSSRGYYKGIQQR